MRCIMPCILATNNNKSVYQLERKWQTLHDLIYSIYVTVDIFYIYYEIVHWVQPNIPNTLR